MKIRGLKVIHCDAGWRPWSFLKIETDVGIDGWSECSESNGSPRGIAAVLGEFEPLLVGSDPREVERIYWMLYSRTRQSAGGLVQKAIAAVENALLDIKAKSLGVPVSDLCVTTFRFTGRIAARLACVPLLSSKNPRSAHTRTLIPCVRKSGVPAAP
jgi:L-alanine-DL-glutamate epimerase-like enolase superfamily enzyme